MFNWLWRWLGLSRQDIPGQIEYDPVYGLSRRSLDEWLAMNPRLAAAHKILEKSVRDRRNGVADQTGDSQRVETIDSGHLAGVKKTSIEVASCAGVSRFELKDSHRG